MCNGHLALQKERLIQRLKASGYLSSEQVENAMRIVPREEFVLPELRNDAYLDTPLPLIHGQTISAPHMCAIMCEALHLEVGHKVLEIGGGSGYHAALCAEIVAPRDNPNAGHVFTVEIIAELVELARRNLERCGYADRVTVVHGDGGLGLPAHAPFDRILVTAAAPKIPPPLLEQLKQGGRMLIPIGGHIFYQELVIVEKDAESRIRQRNWGGVAFVPLTGEYGH